MKKSLIFVGMLAIGFANAQEGNVGINTDQPKATLDIQPNATNLAGTTNEGILAPRLSKTRIANIEANKLTEGTLVYATDDATSPISAYAGTDTKVAKITEKGYYFYNGTEWVKTSATDGGEWVHNGTDAIYAKRAKDATKSNLFEILDNGRTYTNQGNVDWTTFLDYENRPQLKADPRGLVPNLTLQSSDILPLKFNNNDYINGRANYSFNNLISIIKQEHLDGSENGSGKSYTGTSMSISSKGNAGDNVNLIEGVNFGASIDKNASGNYGNIRGAYSSSTSSSTSARVSSGTGVWADASASGEGAFVSNIRGVYGAGFVQNNASASVVKGGEFQGLIRQTDGTKPVNYLKGIESIARNTTGGAPISSKILAGQFVTEALAPVTYNGIRGIEIDTNLGKEIEVSGNVRGINTTNNLGGKTEIADVRGVNISNVINDANIKVLAGVQSDLIVSTESTAKVENYYAFKSNINNLDFGGTITNYYDFHSSTHPNNATNKYGIYILGGNKTNYLQGSLGIGTNKPTEKLEVDGKIKTSSLAQTGAGDRVVYADENGVLKTGGSIAANNGVQTQATMECNEDNRGKMNFGRISINSKETDAIGFCMKNGDNQFRWYYIYGGTSHTVGTNANFGQGL